MYAVLRIRIRWIRNILAPSWIRVQIHKNMQIHGFGSKGQNNNQKLKKKNVYSQTPNLNYCKKRDYKNFMIFEWSSSFSIKISEKIRQQIGKFCVVKKKFRKL